MPQLLKTDIVNSTHRRDLPGYEHWDQHNYVNKALLGTFADVVSMFNAPTDGLTDIADYVEEAIAYVVANGGGVVTIPKGRYAFSRTIAVPSRVTISGAGRHATRLYHQEAHTGYLFETTTAEGDLNQYGQNFGVIFRDFTIEDRNSSDVPTLQGSGRSEEHHGIWLEDSDWGQINNVTIRDLAGTALNCADTVREWFITNLYTQNCASATVPAVDINSATGDATNTIYFIASRIIFSAGIGVRVNGTQDGIRLITFNNCQVEGGGLNTGVNYGDPHPYDLVSIGLCQTITFNNCNFSNPGVGKFCINIDGSATSNVNRVDITGGCRFNGNASGGNVRVHRVDEVMISMTLFEGATVAEADIYLDTGAGIVYVDPSVTYSPNEFAGSGAPTTHIRGRYGPNLLTFRDHVVSYPNGGLDLSDGKIQPTHAAGAEGFFGSSAENTMLSYTVPANLIGTTGGVRLRAAGKLNFSGGATTVRLRVKLGGVTVCDTTSASLTLSGDRPWWFDIEIRNIGAQNTNRVAGSFEVSADVTPAAGLGGFGTPSAKAIVGAETTADFSAAVAVAVTIQLGAARDNIKWWGRLDAF